MSVTMEIQLSFAKKKLSLQWSSDLQRKIENQYYSLRLDYSVGLGKYLEVFQSDNYNLKIVKKSMEYFKKMMSMVCLFDIETQQKQGVNLKRYITVRNQNLGNPEHELDETAIIKELCSNLKAEEKGSVAAWVKPEKNKKVLLLDLDKTLIYFSHPTGLLLRPFLNEFLNELKNHYSIYVFTSATKGYVKEIFERAKLQKAELSCIKGLLMRQNCIKIEKENAKNVYVKDLKILTGCSLSDVIIVDDLPVSYCLNQSNAMPISAFTGESSDNELKAVMKKLVHAAQYEDVRDYLSQFHCTQKKVEQKTVTHIKVQKKFVVSRA